MTNRAILPLMAGAIALTSSGSASAVSFQNEVMAVFSKAGCNQGACHGNQNGKNGFRLSLRGQDPEFDFRSLKRNMLGRRVNPLHPGQSLLLLKATGSLPHEGGRRFSRSSREYKILHQWIKTGLKKDPPNAPVLTGLRVTPSYQRLIEPEDHFSIKVTATYESSREVDVTALSVFEVFNDVVQVGQNGKVTKNSTGEATILVRYLQKQAAVRVAIVPQRPNFVWSNPPEVNYIDKHVLAKLRHLKINPSVLSSDTEFLRRAYLDAIGLLPSPTEARAFLKDSAPNKRARLIDDLVKRKEFADFWALKWADLLRIEEKTLDRKGVQVFHQWLQSSIASGKPLSQMANELISAKGSTYKTPPANYYRALRDPNIRAEATAQVFLGLRLQCARCHNHPFEQWTQDDYHSLAAFFAGIEYKIVKNKRKDKFDKHEFNGEQIVLHTEKGKVTNPRTGKPAFPRFLHGSNKILAKDRLEKLAEWVVHPDNPFFAKAQANRIWFHLFGQGLVEPNDDFRASNPPSNPELLDALAKDLIQQKHDLRALVRRIMQSRAYQLSSVPNNTNKDDQTSFSHAMVRPLQAEQLLDACAQVTGSPARFNGYPLGTRAGQIPGVRAFRPRDKAPTDAERFLTIFGKPPRSLSCECERAQDTTLAQAFQFITGSVVNRMLSDNNNALSSLLERELSDRDRFAELTLATLSRSPKEAEWHGAKRLLDRSINRREAWEDILWSLMSSKEFFLRR